MSKKRKNKVPDSILSLSSTSQKSNTQQSVNKPLIKQPSDEPTTSRSDFSKKKNSSNELTRSLDEISAKIDQLTAKTATVQHQAKTTQVVVTEPKESQGDKETFKSPKPDAMRGKRQAQNKNKPSQAIQTSDLNNGAKQPKTALAARAELRPKPILSNEKQEKTSKNQGASSGKEESSSNLNIAGGKVSQRPSQVRKTAKIVSDIKSKSLHPKPRPAAEIKLVELAKSDDTDSVKIQQENAEKVRLAKAQNFDRKRHTMPVLLRVLFSFLLLAGCSFIFTWFILWRQNLCELEPTQDFINSKPALFAYSWIIVFLLMAIIASLTWRVFFTIGISFSIASIISFINIQKFTMRATPLVPEDFLMADQAGNITQFVDFWSIVRLVAGVILIMIGVIFLEICADRVIGRDKRGLAWWDRFAFVPRASFFMASLAAFSLISHPVLVREAPEWLEGADLVGWNQAENYLKNGFIIGFLYNFGRLSVDPPDDYSEETMREIAQKYQDMKKADEKNPRSNRRPIDEIAENIIVILDETFYDPELLTKYYSHRGGDPLPNLRQIFRDYPSGYMYSPEYGGGTANVEFEVQTGLSNYWANSMPYVNSIPKTHGVLSVANWAKNLGFKTTAIHTYDGTMYKRNWVYPLIGYDTFIDEDLMTHTEKENLSLYINDRSVFLEVLDLLEENDEPQMIAAVTMQNHSPYNIAQYPELNYALTDVDSVFLECSFESLHYADQYVGEFLEALDNLDEPTVVLWFGDHAAGLLDLYTQSEDKADRDLAHLTPYFIYANFDIESQYTSTEVAEMNAESGFEFPANFERNIDLPVVSPNCLQNTMYDILDAEKPALFYLVDEVCKEVPILTLAFLGNTILEQTEALHDYELVNYDVLGGEQYWDGK